MTRPMAAIKPIALAALVATVSLWSRAVHALCPNCLGQESALSPTLKLVGLFLLVPFAVATAVYLVVRRTLYGRAAAPPSPSPASPAPPSSAGGVQAG